jgi:transposase
MTLKIDDPRVEFTLQDEIRRSKESRYNHRLHAILLIANGMKCSEVSSFLGDPERTVRRWIHRYNRYGFPGLMEIDHLGRPSSLKIEQIEKISSALQTKPDAAGFRAKAWNGKLVSEFIRQEFDIRLGIRQCQRFFLQYGSNLKGPQRTKKNK